MDSENMKRVGLYLDKDLVKQFHFKSRNEFFAAAVENYIADYLLSSSESAVSDKLGKSIAKYSEDKDGNIKSLTPKQVADLLGHTTSEITELYYVRRDMKMLNGITDGFEL